MYVCMVALRKKKQQQQQEYFVSTKLSIYINLLTVLTKAFSYTSVKYEWINEY